MTDPFAPIPRDTAEWVDITDTGLAVGYPVHRPIAYRQWISAYRLDFVDWRAFCGAIGTMNGGALRGPLSVFGQVTQARAAELCPTCYPGRDWRHPAR
jgi:hypothetical protein